MMSGFKPTSQIGQSLESERAATPARETLRTTHAGMSGTAQGDLSFAVRHPARAQDFADIRTGPEFQIEHEQNAAPPVEGSDPLLRMLSPFVVRLEPPLVFGDLPAMAPNQVPVDAFTVAGLTSRGYTEARRSLSAGGTTSPTDPVLAKTQRHAGKLGEPAIADFLTAMDIHHQLQAVLKAPPLVLLVNPDSMRIAYTKIQQYTERTRYGYLFHAHGEEQPKISISARCGAFYSGGRGVRVTGKRDSLAWQNLMNAFAFYKNNGYIYDSLGQSNAHHFVGCLSIHYDQWIYYGHMDSFTWTYDESNQHGNIAFEIEFTVSAMVDTAQSSTTVRPMIAPVPNPSDSRYWGRAGGASGEVPVASVSSDWGSITVSGSDPNWVPTAFRQSPSETPPGQRQVLLSEPAAVSPFGRR